MKKFKNTAIAALTANHNAAIAVLTFSVASIDTANSQRVQLLPDGYFSAKDGRPEDVANGKWLMDEIAFAALKASAAQRENDYHFDYEHQTMLSEKNGKPAPAAGWFKNLEYIPGEGLFALHVDWTPPATIALKNKEYRFTSAVFEYDTKTGRPIGLRHVALTNDPALDGMKAIAVLKHTKNHSIHNREAIMPNKLGSLLSRLMTEKNITTEQMGKAAGIEASTVSQILNGSIERPPEQRLKGFADVLGVSLETLTKALPATKMNAALKTLLSVTVFSTDDEIDQAVASLKQRLTQGDENSVALVALKAGGAKEINPADYVPVATYNAVNTELAALKNGTDENSVEQLLKDNAAKITGQADRDYLATVGKSQGAAALKAMLAPRIAIAALTKNQTDGKETPKDKGTDLSTEQIAMCKNMGLSHDEFKVELAKESGDQ